MVDLGMRMLRAWLDASLGEREKRESERSHIRADVTLPLIVSSMMKLRVLDECRMVAIWQWCQ